MNDITPWNTPEIVRQELSTDMSPTSEYEADEMKCKPTWEGDVCPSRYTPMQWKI